MKTDISEAAQSIIETRDLCGDEHEALKQWQSDNRKLTSREIDEVRREVGRQWLSFQRQAGAKVLTSEDRQAAFRDIQSGK